MVVVVVVGFYVAIVWSIGFGVNRLCGGWEAVGREESLYGGALVRRMAVSGIGKSQYVCVWFWGWSLYRTL